MRLQRREASYIFKLLWLTFGRVFKSAVNNGAKKLGLQNKISEIGSVDTNIVTPGRNQLKQK